MKKRSIVISIVGTILLGISTYSFFVIQSYRREISNLRQSKEQTIEELNKQEKFSKELKEELNKNTELLTNITKDLEKSNKKIEEIERERIVEQSTNNIDNNQTSEISIKNSSVTENQENYYNDPLTEREDFSAQFKEENGRAPSSGEVQMDWLRKQGIVE